jgi:acyl carrier protein
MAHTYDQIFQTLQGILEKVSVRGTVITPETGLTDQLKMDSMKVLDIIMEIEDELDISVPMNNLVDVNTVGELAQLLFELDTSKS